MSALEASLLYEDELCSCKELSHFIPLFEEIRLDHSGKTRPDNQNGGFIAMNEIKISQIKGLTALFSGRVQPKQIYEICVPDGEYKNYLIQRLPREFECYAIINDQHFNALHDLTDCLASLTIPFDLIIMDLSEILYLEFIHDFEHLQRQLQEFYDRLKTLTNLGTTCIVFSNFIYHDQVFQEIWRPEVIQIIITPSEYMPGYWEAQILNPPELRDRKSLFQPFKEDIPFLT